MEGTYVREGMSCNCNRVSEPSPQSCTTVHSEVGGEGSQLSFVGSNWTRRPRQLEVQGLLNEEIMMMLLDTGAALSIVSPRLIRRSRPELAAYIERNLRPTSQRLSGCSGTSIRCRGVITLRVRVGYHAWKEPEVFVLDECPHACLIGWPALTRESFKLDTGTGEGQFGNGPKFPFVLPSLSSRWGSAAVIQTERTEWTKGGHSHAVPRSSRDSFKDTARGLAHASDKRVRWRQPLEEQSRWTPVDSTKRAAQLEASSGRDVGEPRLSDDARDERLVKLVVHGMTAFMRTMLDEVKDALPATESQVAEAPRSDSSQDARRRKSKRKAGELDAAATRKVGSRGNGAAVTLRAETTRGGGSVGSRSDSRGGAPLEDKAVGRHKDVPHWETQGMSTCRDADKLRAGGSAPSGERVGRDWAGGQTHPTVYADSPPTKSSGTVASHTQTQEARRRDALQQLEELERMDRGDDVLGNADLYFDAYPPPRKVRQGEDPNWRPLDWPTLTRDDDLLTDGKDETHQTTQSYDDSQALAKKQTRKSTARRKRRSATRAAAHRRPGSQPATCARSQLALPTRARRRSSVVEYVRVCPVKSVPLPTCGPVNVAEQVELPPMSECNVQVTLVHDNTTDKSAHYLFEPTPVAKMKGKLWRAAACLVQRRRSGVILVRVMNPTAMKLTLYAGTALGSWEHLSTKQVMSIQVLDDGSESDSERQGDAASVQTVGVEETKETEETKEDAAAKHATEAELRAKIEEQGAHLTEDQRERLIELLVRFRFMFRDTPGRTDVVRHVINTGDHRPIRGGRYRQSEKEKETVRQIVKDMQEAGVVRPSKSPWGASVVLVPKKCGATRFCVDYRRLNEITVKDVYPLPRIDDTLDQLVGCVYFTAMDLTSGYWQVDLADRDAAKTAFMTADGLYEFTAMPFGLCNAPATFQRLMDQVLGQLRYEYALVYLDDVMVHSKTFDEHLEHLESVLSCLQRASLACKLKKCNFAQESTVYLGHVVSARGIEPEPAKIKAVQEIAPPTSVKEIRMFLGFVGYYRRFINNFSAVAQPLNSLLRKSTEWKWGVEQQDAFEALRDALVAAPILQMPDFTKNFTIRTDASYLGLGACLLQGDGDQRLPIAYASRSLKPAETRYTATEIECLGMKWAVGVFRPYIHGRRFTLETDHIALKWLRTVQHTNGRLIRTAMELQQYDMEVVHRPGIKMYDADALSRLRRDREDATGEERALLVMQVTDQAVYYGEGDPTPLDEEYDEPAVPCEITDLILSHEQAEAQGDAGGYVDLGPVSARVCPVLGQDENSSPDGLDQEGLLLRIAEERGKDPYYANLYRQLSKEDLPVRDLTTRLRNDLNKFVVRNGHLYRIEQLYRGGRAQAGNVRYLLWIPEALRADVLFACHDHLLSGGHLGVQKTFSRLRLRYYWTGMFKAVEDWCKSCPACASRKDPAGMVTPLQPLPVPAEPFQMVSVDVCGPFVQAKGSGNRYVIVYCDHLTRWVETVAIRRNDSAVMARVLVERVMCRHGAPQVLLSDRGRPFMSALAREVYRILRVKKVNTAAYRPQTNGLVERFNRTLAAMLSMYVDSKHSDWDRYLPYITFAYNTTPHAGTKESPFFLLYGREARLPIDAMLLPLRPHDEQSVEEYRKELVEGLRLAHEWGREALERSKQQLELQRGDGRRVPEFTKDEEVMVKNPAVYATPGLTRKLTNTWSGPFRIISRIGPTTYEVTGVSGRGRAVNVNRLKKYYGYDHPEAVEADYADHLETAGEPLPSEGNRTYAPTEEEAKLPVGDGEAPTSTDTPVVDVPQEEAPVNQPASETEPRTTTVATRPRRRGRPRGQPPPSTSIVRRPEPGPELGLITPVPPGGGLRSLCLRCHQRKRNHTCQGRYIPVRQLQVARRRLGLADPGQKPIFGMVDITGDRPKVFGVYASNDVRRMNVLPGRLTSWEDEAKRLGRSGDAIWNESCFACEGRGKVYTCYGCNLAFHPKCSVSPVLDRPLRVDEEFLCPDCLRDCVDQDAPLVQTTVQPASTSQ